MISRLNVVRLSITILALTAWVCSAVYMLVNYAAIMADGNNGVIPFCTLMITFVIFVEALPLPPRRTMPKWLQLLVNLNLGGYMFLAGFMTMFLSFMGGAIVLTALLSIYGLLLRVYKPRQESDDGYGRGGDDNDDPNAPQPYTPKNRCKAFFPKPGSRSRRRTSGFSVN